MKSVKGLLKRVKSWTLVVILAVLFLSLVSLWFMFPWYEDRFWIALTAVCSLVLAVAVPFTIQSSHTDVRNRFYAQLDQTYLEIQKMLIERPFLSPHFKNRTAEQVIQYDAFAFITWNFIESIYDYGREDKVLLETWQCISSYEANLHRDWMLEPGNHCKFKSSFLRHIKSFGIDTGVS